MSTDRNILFGVQALALDLIDSSQFIDACEDWAGRKETSLAEILVKHGAITQHEKQEVSEILERQLESHDGDVRTVLGAVADIRARDSIRIVKDQEVQRTLNDLPPPHDRVHLSEVPAGGKDSLRYSNSREFKRGGLGRTWLVQDDDLNREVVLKELHPEHSQSEEARRRFMKEAQVTGQLEHPSIVPVYELGEGKGKRPYYTMRFVRGQTLLAAINAYHRRRRARKAGSFDERRLLIAFVHVCNAVAYAHSRGVVHRDLKPENIVLGGFGEVILLDWGLAKLLDQQDSDTVDFAQPKGDRPDETKLGSVVGTPAYMAPEQARGEPGLVTSRTDIYGLGAVLFHILTGKPPHTGNDAAKVIRNINEGETPRARAIRPSVPRGLNAICAVCMEKDGVDRYATASDLAEDIRKWLADEPVTAYRPPVTHRVMRWARHHRAAAAAALIAGLSLLTGVTDLLWQRSNAIEHERQLLGMETLQATGGLLSRIENLREDVLYLSEARAIPAIVGSGDSGSVEDLQTHLAEFLRHKPIYLQARLLSRDGHELVRVDAVPGGVPAPVPAGDLQYKGDYAYFKEAAGLPPGELYLSAIELNEEQGRVDDRRIPVMRASAPVHLAAGDASPGTASGVVVINMDVRRMLGDTPGPARFGSRTIYVTNNEGMYLWYPDDPSKTFGDSRIQADIPELDRFFATTDSEGVSVTTGEDPRDVYLHKLYPDASDRSRFLAVAIAVPHEELLNRATANYSFPLYALVALSLALLVTMYFVIAFSRRWHPLRGSGRMGMHLAERLVIPRRRAAKKKAE